MTAAVRLKRITYEHQRGGEPALREVSLRVAPAETIALLGPSGAGKTTLLALLDGRLRRWRGSAEVLGRALRPERAPTPAERAAVGFVFQEFALVERATVRQNVLNGRLGRADALRALFGRFSEADIDAAEQAMDEAGISDLADRRADRLSGGQRQRVAIARCLAQQPRLILADEPVSNLDPAHAHAVLGLITDAARARGAAVLFSSHQPELARRHARRVIGIRDGRIAFDCAVAALGGDTLERLYRPESAKAAPALRIAV